MEKLNNELLKEPEPEKEKTVKRNSKDELVKKIVELSKNTSNSSIRIPNSAG